MNNIFIRAQIECKKMAQSAMHLIGKFILITSFVLCFVNLQRAYHEKLQQPTLNNELKYEFKLLGAAEKVKKQSSANMWNTKT